MENEKPRLLWADLLRIISMAGIVLMHTSADYWDAYPVSSPQWLTMNFYDAAVRWSLPMFIMISGMFFLNPQKEISIKKIFDKYISRLLLVFFGWSLFYAVLVTIKNMPQQTDTITFIGMLISGYLHMWFLYMIMGLYIITPILRKFTEDDKISKYFVALCFVFSMAIPFILSFWGDSVYDSVLGETCFYFPMGFTGLFVWGHYLNKHAAQWTHKKAAALYIAGAASVLITMAGNAAVSLISGEASELFFVHTSPFHFIAASAIFVFFRRADWSKFEKYQQLTVNLSKLTLGVYLAHIAMLGIVKKLSIHFMAGNLYFINIPLAALLVIAMSFAAVYVMKKIPLLRKLV